MKPLLNKLYIANNISLQVHNFSFLLEAENIA